jgi:O-antigen ligase
MGCYSAPFSALLLIFALQKKWKPALLWALFIFTAIIVLLNNSRAGWVMYGVVASVFSYKAFVAPLKHRFLMCIALLALGVALGSGLYTVSNTFKKRVDKTLLAQKVTRKKINRALSDRVAVWESAIGIIRDYPINGVGARNYRLLSAQYWPDDLKKHLDNALYPHQLILEYAAGTGAIGVIGLLVSMGLCLRWWRKASAKQRETAAGYALTLLALYFPLNTHKAMFSSEIAVSLWIVIALYASSVLTVCPTHSLPEAQE